jgi:transposase-like protein
MAFGGFMDSCGKCGHCKLVKYGKTRGGNRRFKCLSCPKVMNAPVKRGKSTGQKSLAILLYSMFAASFKGIGRFLKVSDVAVYKWIKKYAESPERPKIPMPPETT